MQIEGQEVAQVEHIFQEVIENLSNDPLGKLSQDYEAKKPLIKILIKDFLRMEFDFECKQANAYELPFPDILAIKNELSPSK